MSAMYFNPKDSDNVENRRSLVQSTSPNQIADPALPSFNPHRRVSDTYGLSDKIMQAVQRQDVTQLNLLLSGLDKNKKETLLNNVAVNDRPILVYAAVNGNLEMVKCLLDHNVNPALTSSTGRTALHEAVHAGYAEITKALLQHSSCDETDGLSPNHKRASRLSTSSLAVECLSTLTRIGVLVNTKDQVGLTPLLILSEAPSLTSEEFTTLVRILIENGASTDFLHPGNGQTALYRAVELNAVDACKELIQAGVCVNVHDIVGDTVLHLASRMDRPAILKLFLGHSRESVNAKNKKGETPLHCAAMGGSRDCLQVLLDFGGDLADVDNDSQSALDAIFSYLPRPTNFLIETLDSKIMTNGCGLNDRRLQLTLDFRILSPDRTRQTAVVVALMNALANMDRKRVLSHPLIETYMRAKWRRMRAFFFVLVVIHLLFVTSLSAHVIWILYPNDTGKVWSRRVLMTSATILMIHVAIQTALSPRYFLQEAETWLSLTCVCMAFSVSLAGELPPPAFSAVWVRHVASVSVLLAWGQMMFIIGRFPAVGFFALMFFTVFKNVMKVLLISACLVIGFSLSFCIQFNKVEYEGAWQAILRTTVMLMGEYQYEVLFPAENEVGTRWVGEPGHLFLTSQVIFLLFILLGSVVLVNLMIGLAVSDIQGLKAEGDLRHMMKQAEFLLHMDILLSFSNIFKNGRTTPSMVTINPNSNKKMKKISYKMMGLSIPSRVMEGLIKVALKSQGKNSDVSTEDGLHFYQTSRDKECNCDMEVLA